ncbi:MAG TPA: zincin-like metallopeptidase domain-containing protein, partial [Terrimicrobium sp.]
MNRDIYEAITGRFIEQLKRGTVPWQKPWFGVQNIVSRKPYRGINALLLGSTDYQSPFWISFRQALDLGGHVKKGEKSTPVIYYKILEKRDEAGKVMLREDGTPARIPFVRWANVFNLDQTEGIPAPTITANQGMSPPHERAAAIVENARLCPIHHAGFAAFYSPTDDVIRIPAPSTFHSQEDYYHTLYHELTHASGHPSRLNREGVTERARIGSERYSKDELIGELGAAFLSDEAGILDSVRFENLAAYLGSWVQKLENDPRIIVSAASQAQRSGDFITGIEHKESLQECQISPKGCRSAWRGSMGSIPGFPALPTAIRTGRGFNSHGMEAWNQADRTAFPATEAVPMKGISANSLAHLRLNRARLHSSRRRVLVAPAFGTAANQRKSPEPLGFARPFAPSSPRPDTRLRAERIGGLIFSPGGRRHPLSVPGHCDRLPLSGECDRLLSTLWLASKRHARARNGQGTNASCPFPESGQTDGFRCRIGTPF